MKPGSWLVLVVVALSLLAAGCSTNDAPTLPPTSTSPSPIPRPTVAPVVRSLDAASYQTKTCDLLTGDQKTELKLPPQDRQGYTRDHGSCVWQDKSPATTVSVWLELTENPLESVYRNSNNPQWRVFEPVMVAGQPAVKRWRDAESLDHACQVFVGLGPNQGLDINTSGPDTTVDWCGLAIAAAEFMVRNLGGG